MTTEAPPRRKRGRPRDPSADRRILDAARAVVADLGVHGASMSAIAGRAGVGKPTIYLRWANRDAVIAAALDELPGADATGAVFLRAERELRALAGMPDGAFLTEVLVSEVRRERQAA